MNTGGEAAEQIVRMSLEGFEVAAKITGAGAKNIAILLYSILKEERKTKGKARLTSMLRSGKELKVFTVKNGDLKKFTQEAKKYGVLYCVLTDRKNKDPNAEVDVIARAEDASKISRIVERFNLASVDTASIVTEAEKSKDAKDGQPEPDIGVQEKAEKDKLLDPVYCGKIAYGRRTREKVKGTKNEYKQVHAEDYILEDGQHEGIISEELWQKVHAKRMATGIKQPSKVGKDRSHLLTGILKCPLCGSAMYTNKHAWTNKDGTYKEV